MLASLIVWFYAGLLSLIFGQFVIWSLQKLFRLDEAADQEPSLSLTIILGLIALTTISSFLSLGIKIGWLVDLLFLIGALVIIIVNLKKFARLLTEVYLKVRQIHPLIWLALIPIFLVVLILSADPPYNYDTGLYHAQTIHWIETSRVVPGLGNFYGPLALNSSWLLTSALFSFSFLGYGSFHNLVALLTLLFVLFSLQKLNRLIHGEISISNLMATIMILFVRRFFLAQMSSPGTDLPATLIILIIFIISIEKFEQRRITGIRFDRSTVLILIFSVFVLTIKLSVLPVLLLTIYILIQEFPKIPKSRYLAIPAIAAIVLFPWFTRNIILSGYLVYPFPRLDLFPVDWKIPLDRVKDAAGWIKSWSRIQYHSKDIVLNLPASQWIPRWFAWQNIFDRQVMILILAGIPVLGISSLFYLWFIKTYWRTIKKYSILYIVLFVATGFWFIQAPNPRFAYGFLLTLVCLLYLPFIKWIVDRIRPLQKPLVFLLLIGVISYWGMKSYKMRDFSLYRERLLFPVAYPQPQVKEKEWQDTIIYLPASGDQCFYDAFPCTPNYPPDLDKMGTSLSDGFRIIPTELQNLNK